MDLISKGNPILKAFGYFQWDLEYNFKIKFYEAFGYLQWTIAILVKTGKFFVQL